jgi:rhodanese-related sulfurtransferase
MRKRSLILIALLLVVALTAVACGKDNDKKTATFTTLDVQAAYTLYNDSDNAVIVDVRNPDEWTATGTIPGAALIPLPQFEQRAPGELPKDKEIFVICNSGNRSRVASEELIKLGYEHVINIDGGMQAWLSANLPVAAYTP